MLASRDPLTLQERRVVAELRPVADRGVDVQHRHLADKRVLPNGHRSDLDSASLSAIALEARLASDHRSGSDRQQIGANGDVTREDHSARAYSRAEGSEIQPVQG